MFDALALKFPQVQFKWVDVEDEADVIDPIEVENFPTILIAAGEKPLFFGTVLPHIEQLARLIQEKSAVGVKPMPHDAALERLSGVIGEFDVSFVDFVDQQDWQYRRSKGLP